MELDEFIEQDMMLFLDERLEKPQNKGFQSRPSQKKPAVQETIRGYGSYKAEFFTALDHHDISKAKQVLGNLKHEFDQCPTNAPQKSQLKFLLLDLYEQFKDHLDAQNTFNSIEQRLDGKTAPVAVTNNNTAANNESEPLPPPELLKDHKDTASTQNTSQATAISQDASSQTLSETIIPDNSASIRSMIAEANTAISDSRPLDAIRAYKRIKQSALESKSIDDSLFKEITALHSKISEILKTRTIMTEPQEKNEDKISPQTINLLPQTINSEAEKSETDADITKQLDSEKKMLDLLVKKNDISGAMLQYRKLKLLTQQIQDKNKRKDYEQKLLLIYSALHDIMLHMKKEETELKKVLP